MLTPIGGPLKLPRARTCTFRDPCYNGEYFELGSGSDWTRIDWVPTVGKVSRVRSLATDAGTAPVFGVSQDGKSHAKTCPRLGLGTGEEEKMIVFRRHVGGIPGAKSVVILRAALLASFLAASVALPAQTPNCTFVRGDITGTQPGDDPIVDLNDGVNILAFLFLGTSVPNCVAAADINDNGLVELSDYTYLVNYLFNGGPAPPAPFPAAGTDPTPGVTVSDTRDTRFQFSLGTGAGVPSNTGIAIPVTMSNTAEITGLTLVIKFDATRIRIDELVTEENTILSAQSADYIIAEQHNVEGIAVVAALKDFATPFWFQVGDNPSFPVGQDQLVCTLKCGVLVSADKGFGTIELKDGLKIPNNSQPGVPQDTMPDAHNLVMLGDNAVRPVFAQSGGIDVRRGFIRGDANKDDGVDISDSVWLLDYIFKGGRVPPCLDAADANNDTRVDISDSIWLLNYLFKGGPQPSEPFPQAGVDPSDDGKGSLGCDSDN